LWPVDELNSSNRPRTFFFGLILLLAAGSLAAQESFDLSPSETPAVEWQVPDLADLPADWWQSFDNASSGTPEARFEQLYETLRRSVGQLDGEQLLTGQSLLQSIRTQFELLRLARGKSDAEPFEPVPLRDDYTLAQYFELRHLAAQLEKDLSVPLLRIDELDHQAELVQARRDSLLIQYQAADVNTPERLLSGLRLIETRFVSELTDAESAQLKRRAEELREQHALVEERVDYARAHLVADPEASASLQRARDDARSRFLELTDNQASVQRQLLEALSASETRPSLLVLRKQQLTRASVEQALSRLEFYVLEARNIWNQQRIDGEGGEIDESVLLEARAFIDETSQQIESWSTSSRNTLLSPIPGDTLNAVKNMELAQAIAQETLAYVDDITQSIDDLEVLGDLIDVQRIGMQHGLWSVWTRLRLVGNDVSAAFSSYVEITLFHIGDVPVTVGSIFTMLMILVFGWAISWFLRHLVDRLKNRRQFASSPAVYTLSRLLHYIIIFIAVLAAFGSIGLDFSNFALIAGALSVGIGFGLQSVVNNFVSGLILLFEGSLRVGDYIELDTGLRGLVKEINTRATVVRTNDSIDVVVPNSQFITNQLTNWTLREPLARFRIEFGVAYGSDKEAVRAAALEAANRVDFIVHNMPSRPVEVWLTDYGDSALVFQLLAWVSKAGVRRPERVRAAVLWELETQLSERGIQIPFPQRDLHLRSGFLPESAAEPDAGKKRAEPVAAD